MKLNMKIKPCLSVTCSHEAFRSACKELYPQEKDCRPAWWYMEDIGDDGDTDYVSSFSFPCKDAPEFTLENFWEMAFKCLSNKERGYHASLFMQYETEDNSIRMNDYWRARNYGDSHYISACVDRKIISEDMEERLQKIRKIASSIDY